MRQSCDDDNRSLRRARPMAGVRGRSSDRPRRGVGAIVGTMSWLMEHGSYDTWAAIPVAVGLLAISVPMLRRAARSRPTPVSRACSGGPSSLKLLARLPRYASRLRPLRRPGGRRRVQPHRGDSARQFRDGSLHLDLGKPVQGTGFIEILTGAVYTVTGATTIGGFLVFSWFGFWGLYLFHRAFVRACPEGDHFALRRTGLLAAVAALLAVEHRQGSLDVPRAGVVAYGAARLLTDARVACSLIATGTCAGHGATAHRRLISSPRSWPSCSATTEDRPSWRRSGSSR